MGPVPGMTAVAPKPTMGAPLVAVVRIASIAVSRARPSGSGMATAQPSALSRTSRSTAMYQSSIRRRRARSSQRRRPDRHRPPASRRRSARRGSMRASGIRLRPGPDRRTARRSPHHGRTLHGGHQVGIATAAGHRERHTPDVARRSRLGRVEVAMRIEPGQTEPYPRPCSRSPASARSGRAVAAQDEQPRPVPAGGQPAVTCPASLGR